MSKRLINLSSRQFNRYFEGRVEGASGLYVIGASPCFRVHPIAWQFWTTCVLTPKEMDTTETIVQATDPFLETVEEAWGQGKPYLEPHGVTFHDLLMALRALRRE